MKLAPGKGFGLFILKNGAGILSGGLSGGLSGYICEYIKVFWFYLPYT